MFHVITQKRLNKVAGEVRREFKALGIALPPIEVTSSLLLSPMSFWAEGYFMQHSWLFRNGRVYVPMLAWDDRNLRDLLRHEFGHGMIYHCGKQFGPLYRNTFGRQPYLTEYATTDREEDFCETLMIYVRQKGKKPMVEGIGKKWRYIERLTFRQSHEGPALTVRESALKAYVQGLRDLPGRVLRRLGQFWQGLCVSGKWLLHRPHQGPRQ